MNNAAGQPPWDGNDDDDWATHDAANAWEQATYEEGLRIAEHILGSISPVRAANTSPAAAAAAFPPPPPPPHPIFGDLDFRQPSTTQPSGTWTPPVPPRPRRPIPPASHSEDWLDFAQRGPIQVPDLGYNLPANFFQHGALDSRGSPASASDNSSAVFGLLEDSSQHSDEEGNMPTRTSRASVIDLTQGLASSPEMVARQPRSLKRTAEASTSQELTPKKSRIDQEIEEIDLANEAPSAEDELLQAQQQAAIRAQQAADENGPQRIGKRQCIICMENYTNCTVTACGHFYCHECLTQALIAGEKNSDRGLGNCPVCRKPLSRNNKKRHDIIPISFMKKETYVRSYQKPPLDRYRM